MPKRTLMLAAFVMVAACGGSNPTANNPSPSPSPSASAQPTSNANANVTLDPCQLVTQQEASQLAGGTAFTAGREETTSGGAKMCVYGGQTTDVFMVEVAVASDAATAQSMWAQEESRAQTAIQQIVSQQGVSINLSAGDITLPGADKAAAASANGDFVGHTLNISAVYVLKGRVFFTFSDLARDKAAPSMSAMEAQAQTVLTRIG